MIVDDAGKKVRLYVDAVEVNQSPSNYNESLADHEDAPYYLGASEPLTNYYEYRFHGVIDEARVFQRALTLAEVQALYAWVPANLWEFSVYSPVIRR